VRVKKGNRCRRWVVRELPCDGVCDEAAFSEASREHFTLR